MPNPTPSLVSIVLPAYNEAGVLEELARRVARAVDACGVDYEIVFVNDGSTDRTGQVMDGLAASDCRVRVIHLSRNFGHQAATRAGLEHAAGDAVVLMDSDLQDKPEAIPAFIKRWREGFEVVYAIRVARKEAIWKRALFAGFHHMLAAVASTKVPAGAGNFSLMDRRVIDHLLALGEGERYLPGLRSWVGFRQTGVEVERGTRYDGRPRVSLRGLCRLAKTAFFSFSAFPLTAIYLAAMLSTAIFLGLLTSLTIHWLFLKAAAPPWTLPALAYTFFASLNALGIAVLGEYASRIYDEVRRRPGYVIDRVQGFDLEPSSPVCEPADSDPQCETDVVRELCRLIEAVQTVAMKKPASVQQPADKGRADAR